MIMITLHEKSIWRGQPEEKKRVCVHTPMCVHWGGICRYSFTLLSDNITGLERNKFGMVDVKDGGLI